MRIFHIIIESHVEGQVFFPSGLTLHCYDTDSTCTTVTNTEHFDYAQDGEFVRSVDTVNFCCFNAERYLPTHYYTVTGSKCQSCSGDACFS